LTWESGGVFNHGLKKKQYNKTTIADAMATSSEPWQNLPARTISSVFGKLPNVLQKIIDDNGRNDLVDGRR
jgi:hypothetical protein